MKEDLPSVTACKDADLRSSEGNHYLVAETDWMFIVGFPVNGEKLL